MLELNWAPLVGGAVVRQATWEKIPADLRPALLKAAAQAGRDIKVAARKECDDAVTAMRTKQGLIVHQPTPEVVDEWRAAAAALYPRIRGKMVPADVFDKVEPMLTDYRARGGEK
jgi:TRAP-type C4-dicarboxylate transport system substrate-binding protein